MGIGCTGKVPIMYIAHKPVLWGCYAFMMPLVAFGLFGNILSFRILGYNKSRRNQSSTFYLRALAIADSMTLVSNTLLMSQQMMLRPAMNLHPLNFISLMLNSYPVCNIRMYISLTTTIVAVYIIVLFSIERALVVVNPFRWMRFFSLWRAKAAVAALTVICCIVCTPGMFSFKKEYYSYPRRLYNISTNATIEAPTLLAMANCSRQEGHWEGNETEPAGMEEPVANLGVIADMLLHGSDGSSTNASERLLTSLERGRRPGRLAGVGLECQAVPECRINFPLFKHFIMFHNFSLTFVPFLVTGVCNFIILMSLRGRETEKVRKFRANEEAQDRQVTKKLIIVSTAFIVLSFPLAMFHLVTGAMSGSYCQTFWADAMTITLTLSAANYAVNFIIYCMSEEQFRRLVLSVLMCQRHRLTRLLSYINEPRNRRAGGGGGGGARGARGTGGGVTGGGTSGSRRKDSNPRTNITTYNSVSQGQDQIDAVAEVLVHGEKHHAPDHEKRSAEDSEDEADREAEEREVEATMTALKVKAAAAEYVHIRRGLAAHNGGAEPEPEKPHDFKNCSLVRDDWASELFADEDARLRAVMARWSEVTPEV